MTTLRLAARSAVALAVTIAVVMIVGGPARAQQPSASSVKMALELIELKGGTRLYQSVVPGVIEQSKNVLLQQNPMLQKDLDATAAALRTFYEPKKAELLTEIARLYAAQFTEQELKEVLAFYKTTAGKKMLTEEPKIIDASMSLAQTWGEKFSEQVMGKFRDEMKKRGHEM